MKDPGQNLTALLEDLADSSAARRPITAVSMKRWHLAVMKGLKVPNPAWIGRFRGEPGLARMRVLVGSHEGALPADVAVEVRAFVKRLTRALVRLDRLFPPGADLTSDGLAAVIEVAAWAHAQWIRIHPFANGNGRTARIMANALLMRYGMPPVLRLRPRPDGGYGDAANAAMRGDHDPTALLILRALRAQTAREV